MMVGEMLNHYLIIERIGAGGMGEVFRAKDTELGREVALKILPESMGQNPQFCARFKREARALAALNHPGIVTIYSVEQANTTLFLTMELVNGRALSDLIPKEGFELDRFLKFAISISEAVHQAHTHGVSHRDLKPQNIMIADDGTPKIVDFGLAKFIEPSGGQSKTHLLKDFATKNRIVGTVAYMSPEQARGLETDSRSDLFSLGIIFYEMLSGGRPFKGDTEYTIIAEILNRDPDPLAAVKPGVPLPLERIIRHCLKKEPDRRFQSALDVRNELEDFKLEYSGHPADRSDGHDSLKSLWQTNEAQYRKHRIVMGVGLIAIAFVLGGLYHFSIRPDQTFFAEGDQISREVRPASLAGRKMVAVLPFENLGKNSNSYFAAGITEEIASRLGTIKELGVISRTSTAQYDESGKSLQQIGRELGVDYILEGAVRWDRDGPDSGRVRVTPKLIRVTDDVQIWADQLDGSLGDVFEIQTEIANQVVTSLDLTFNSDSNRVRHNTTNDPEAIQAYMKGLALSGETREKDVFEAVEEFARAVDLDETFPDAQANLARGHIQIHRLGYDETMARLEQGKEAATKALGLDPETSNARYALGYYFYHGKKDYSEALAQLIQASETAPSNVDVLTFLAAIQRRRGDFTASVLNMETARALDPLNVTVAIQLGVTYSQMRRHLEAQLCFDRAVELGYQMESVRQLRAWNLLAWRGAGVSSNVCDELASSDDEGSMVLLVKALLVSRNYRGLMDVATSLDSDAISSSSWYMSRYQIAGIAHELIGDSDSANSYFLEARRHLEKKVKVWPDDPRIHSALGLVYASLGERALALKEGQAALHLKPLAEDAAEGPVFLEDMAWIFTLLGEYDEAVARLEHLLSIPCWVTVPLLRTDPRWDSLRAHAAFQNLVALIP